MGTTTFPAATAMRMGKLAAVVLVYLHWMASVTFMSASLAAFPDDCWVVRAGVADASTFTQYTYSLFTAVVQMFGEPGLVPPQRTDEMWVSLLSFALGATLYASVLAAITRVIGEMSPSSREFRYKLAQPRAQHSIA